ncbi:MAG: hypothetical protein IPM95_00810 [Sphingobacteriales bacterium]|jgi:hypothetical protein|nr:hypothetical protein [Sphingobacteriales bacterium]
MKYINRVMARFYNSGEDELYLYDFRVFDKIVGIFSVIWTLYIVWLYQNVLLPRPESLYMPINWFQTVFMPTLPHPAYFYSMVVLTLLSLILNYFRQHLFYRIVLFFFILWLNALKWNYNFASHVGHIFVLTYFFSIFLNFDKMGTDVRGRAAAVHWFHAGILLTYTFAGVWKFIGLFYKLFIDTQKMGWLHEHAIELNAIVSKRIHDEFPSSSVLQLYSIPYLWEVLTAGIFLIQLFSIMGSLNKRLSYFFLAGLIIFHLYNSILNNTDFYVAGITLILLFFPYHRYKRIFDAVLIKSGSGNNAV